jgi:hypothetical protein
MVSGYFQSLYNWRFKSPSTVQMTWIPVNHNRDIATEYPCRHPSHQDNLCRYVMFLQTDVISCMASRSAPVTGAFPPYGGPLPFGALPPAINVLGDETRREIWAILSFKSNTESIQTTRLTRDMSIFMQCFIRVHDISPVMRK